MALPAKAHEDGSLDRAAAALAGAPGVATDPPTIWYHDGQSYSVDQINQQRVSFRQHLILAAFMGKKTGMSTRDLKTASGATGVARLISELVKRYGGVFAAAVQTPKGKRSTGGYYVRVRPAPGAEAAEV